MKAIKEVDKKTDAAEGISAYIDTEKNSEGTIVYLDLPIWVIKKIDFEAHKLGVSREAFIVAIIKKSLDKHESKGR